MRILRLGHSLHAAFRTVESGVCHRRTARGQRGIRAVGAEAHCQHTSHIPCEHHQAATALGRRQRRHRGGEDPQARVAHIDRQYEAAVGVTAEIREINRQVHGNHIFL